MPSEMCDERAASCMTAISSAKRNGLSGENVVQSAILQQHWTHGLGAPEKKHQAKLILPKGDASSVIQLPTPTLADLLNPASPNDDTITTAQAAADPYKVSTMWDPDDESDNDSDSEDEGDFEPHVIRGAPRLKIEDYIDLSNKRLLARYDGDTVPAPTQDTTVTAVNDDNEDFDESYSADDIVF
jgi:hypothetical protein